MEELIGNILRLIGKGLAVHLAHLEGSPSEFPLMETPAPETWRTQEDILRSTVSALLASQSRHQMGERRCLQMIGMPNPQEPSCC